MALTRDLLPALEQRRGQVVNIGSVFGDIGFPYFALYSASKFALRGFSEALRRELAPRGISVTIPRRARPGRQRPRISARSSGRWPWRWTIPMRSRAMPGAPSLARKREQFPKSRERFFVALQRLRPQLIDRALAGMAKDPAVIAAARSAETGEKA